MAWRIQAEPGNAAASADPRALTPPESRAFRPSRNSFRTRQRLAGCPEIDCLRHQFPPGQLAAAERRAAEIGTGADQVLIAHGAISEAGYARALATSLGLPFESLTNVPRSACPITDDALIAAVPAGMLWLNINGQRALVMAPHHLAARGLVDQLARHPDIRHEVRLTTMECLRNFMRRHADAVIGRKAAFSLRTAHPEFSAHTPRHRLLAAAMLLLALLATAFYAAPDATAVSVHLALALTFLGWTGLRLAGALMPAKPAIPQQRTPAKDLPLYTIIVALYRESSAVTGLVEALRRLDYPCEKLEIKLVVEPDDVETRFALSLLNLNAPFEIIVAPADGPRTKPKALNAALILARGAFVAVYDAEDRPEPDQLRMALHCFEQDRSRIACVQARLTIDNPADSWLTRMFTAEYAGLFDVFLPGLAAWRMPLPLGGSSNHFRTSMLRGCGGWDPYNVTEDADLGMRLARKGYRTDVIASTTYEEAPSRLIAWLKQRTRWFKGWMQTWLVHMRHPLRLWRDLGTGGFLAFHLVVGGAVLAAMVHGVFAGLLAWQVASGFLLSGKTAVSDMMIAGLHGTTFICGYVMSGLLGWIGLARRGLTRYSGWLLLTPVYWLLLSIAAWRAAIQLIVNPYHWEKTEHGLARHSRLASAQKNYK